MNSIGIAVLGGCHVSGYPIGPDQAFPTLLSESLAGTIVMRIPNLQFVRLPDQLAAIEAAQPSHVVLQLGNYEFSPSLRCLATQFKREFIDQPIKKKTGSTTISSSSTHSSLEGTVPPPASRLAYYIRVGSLGLLTAVLWQFSARHRQSFRALNAYMRQHPATSFVVLSPFPCPDPAATRLRRWGGWLFRRQLAVLPNVQWLDSHRLLGNNRALFVDELHLNARGHRLLAQRLAAVCSRPEPVSNECLA